VSGDYIGGHAVRVIGWGEQQQQENDGVAKYWLVANSWNATWGDGGFFKIARGSDECNFESMSVDFGIPKI
jgi:C1A family cysteine protease